MEQIQNLDGDLSLEFVPRGCSIYIARRHVQGGKYGSDWYASMVLVIDKDVCHAHAGISADKSLSIRNIRPVISFLRSIGVKIIKYSKTKNGVMINHEMAI